VNFPEAAYHHQAGWLIIAMNPRKLNGTPAAGAATPFKADGGLLFSARRLIIYVRDHHTDWALEASVEAATTGLEKHRV
jgi:hypothetical protein